MNFKGNSTASFKQGIGETFSQLVIDTCIRTSDSTFNTAIKNNGTCSNALHTCRLNNIDAVAGDNCFSFTIIHSKRCFGFIVRISNLKTKQQTFAVRHKQRFTFCDKLRLFEPVKDSAKNPSQNLLQTSNLLRVIRYFVAALANKQVVSPTSQIDEKKQTERQTKYSDHKMTLAMF